MLANYAKHTKKTVRQCTKCATWTHLRLVFFVEHILNENLLTRMNVVLSGDTPQYPNILDRVRSG